MEWYVKHGIYLLFFFSFFKEMLEWNGIPLSPHESKKKLKSIQGQLV